MAINLDALLQQFTANSAQRSTALTDAAAALTTQTTATGNQFAAIEQQSKAVADTAAANAGMAAQIDYHRNLALEQAATAAGINPDAENYIIAQRLAEYNAAEDQRKQVRAEVDQMQSVSFLSDPLGAIMAAIKLPSVAAKNNALVDQRDAAMADIQQRQQFITAHKSALVVSSADKVKTLALADAENKRKVAEIQLATARMEMDSKLAGQYVQATLLGDRAFDVQGDLFSKALQVQQFKMSQEQMAEARAQRQAEATLRLQNKQTEADQLAVADANLLAMSKFLGLENPVTVATLKNVKLPKEQLELWSTIALTGMPSDPGMALKLVGMAANPRTFAVKNQGASMAVSGMSAGVQSMAATAMSKDRTLKDKDAAAKGEADYFSMITADAGNLGSKDSLTSDKYDKVFTPYKASHLVMLSDATLKDNAVVKALSAAVQAKPEVKQLQNIPAEVERVALQSIVAQVKNRTLGVDDAAKQITQYYQKAAKTNFDLYQYGAMGLPAQSNYYLTLPPSGFFVQPIKVDAMNFAQTKAALAKMAREGSAPRSGIGFDRTNSPFTIN